MAKKSKKKGPRALERAGALCLAFANTGVPRRDDRRKDSKAPASMPLKRYDELITWSQRMGVLNANLAERLRRVAAERPEEAAAVLAHAVRLRAAITRIFTSLVLSEEPESRDLAAVNGHLQLRRAVPAGDGFDWGWPGDDDALDRPLWALAQSAAELLISDDRKQVGQCGARGCFQLFVRRSPRRIWCDMSTCGNRMKGRRYQKYLKGIRDGLLYRESARRLESLRQEKTAEKPTRRPEVA